MGLELAKSWIETRTRPAYGIFTLVWQHLWYNCITSGYELVVWFEPAHSSGTRNAVYQSGHLIFLRVEPSCWHRVLVADFSAAELRALIASHAVAPPAEYDPNTGR